MKKKLFSEIPVLKGERINLRALTQEDAEGLRELTESPEVYRYLPTFLYEKKYEDPAYVIEHLYDECLKDSLILGIFRDEAFCGLAELYGYNPEARKANIGTRMLPRYWGQGIASETLGLILEYVFCETDVESLVASVMVSNKVSPAVLKKYGFQCVAQNASEDWDFSEPTAEDKWMLTAEEFFRERKDKR